MHIDKISFDDISVFNTIDEFSLFHKLNFTRTAGGAKQLRKIFNDPFSNIEKIKGTQNILKKLMEQIEKWPLDISNGTILMIEKFLDYAFDPLPQNVNAYQSFFYKNFHKEDYKMALFSVSHLTVFIRGLKQIVTIFDPLSLPENIQLYIDKINRILQKPTFKNIAENQPQFKFTDAQNLKFASQFKSSYKTQLYELIDVYYHLDAWYSMAFAVKKFNLVFPEFAEQQNPFIEIEQLYHLLLNQPVTYSLTMNPKQNFIFLTGANMAGKSTFIKAVGAAVFLAHIGMAVPAVHCKLTLFDGLISNINVTDNITKGESYFFNEVQRIKNTIEKISNQKKWLVLIDELFKGTNVQDAMKCSLSVINGLVKMQNCLFILSTHLYEIASELKKHPNITFRFFETNINNDQLKFTYQLNEGISNDRIGYLILKREKVIELLENL